MKTKHILAAFAATALLQLAIPFKMAYDALDTENTGTVYKFRTEPIDPSDPFRGKYITLDYEETLFTSKDTTWTDGEEVYAVLNDSAGFANVIAVTRDVPDGSYFTAKVRYQLYEKLYLDVPFNRYYMEEGKAYEAETAYQNYSRDSTNTKPAYALVAVKDGNAIVRDVIINGMPIRDYVLQEREKPKLPK